MLTPVPHAQEQGSCCSPQLLSGHVCDGLSSHRGCSEGSEAISSTPPTQAWRAALAKPDLLLATGQRASLDTEPGNRCWAEHPVGDAEHLLCPSCWEGGSSLWICEAYSCVLSP